MEESPGRIRRGLKSLQSGTVTGGVFCRRVAQGPRGPGPSRRSRLRRFEARALAESSNRALEDPA